VTSDYKDFAEYIIRRYRDVPIVEIGIGTDFGVFKELKKQNADIKAVDINPATDEVIKDDILNPDMRIYRNCGLIYTIRPPPELLPYIKRIAQKAEANLIVRPLTTDNVHKIGKLKNYKSAIFYKINYRE
jgi:uncharacterized UPF0146 family protein